ncbi:MAG: response regulator [Opitutaceae bacterium]
MNRIPITHVAPHVLHLEDKATEAEAVRKVIRPEWPNCRIEHVRTREDFAAALERAEPDLIISNLSSQRFDGRVVLALAHRRRPDVPFLFVTNRTMEDRAIKALDQGATDYVFIDRLDRLAPVIRRALTEAKDKRQLQYATDEVRLLNKRLHLYARSITDLVWDWDLVTNESWHSGGMFEALGYARNEVKAGFEAWSKLIHPDDVQRVNASLQAALSGAQERWEETYRFRHKRGHYLNLRAEGLVDRDKTGRAVRMVGSLTDMTKSSHAEGELMEHAAFLDQASDAISLMDLDDRIRFWSKGAERMYGWSAAEASDRKSTELIDQGSEEYEEAKRVLLVKGRWIGELRKMARDGRTLTIEARWTLLRDGQGNPKSVLAIDTDLTERERLEVQSLRNQRMESLGTLASGIAHDLNNVLAPMCMSIALLKLKIPDDKETMRVLDVLETNSRRGARLIKQVLTFGRGIEGERIVVDLGHIIREIEEIVHDTFPKPIQFSAVYPEEHSTVTGDPTQLHQVLLNLSVNARDAMPDGGKLTISLENATLDSTYAAMNPEAKPGPYVVVTVADTGGGIPKDIQDKIFDPFFTTKEAGKGTGLGLSTSLAIVKGHGGFITVHSELHRGTVFKIYLPANAVPWSADSPEDTQADVPHGNNELILVVDDEEPIRIVMEETLKKFGYRVMLASNGAEAISHYAMHQEDIAVVVTDMVMPVMDGLATVFALKTINPRVKIIGSSGMGSDPVENRAKAINAGVKHFISKPFAAEALLRMIGKIIHRGSRPPR